MDRRVLSAFCAMTFVAVTAAAAPAMIVRSPDVGWERPVKNLYVWNRDGCRGKNQSPALSWTDVPASTARFAVTVFDPDAPTGHGWVHWLRTGIAGDVRALERADATHGTDGPNDYGTSGYGGPCPPKGANRHRYVFTVYALDATSPALDRRVTYAQFLARTRGHVLARAQLVTRYGRR